MASGAFNSFVPAFQFKPGLIVIETICSPGLKTVASGAFGRSVHTELALVYVGMTFLTLAIQRVEPLFFSAFISFFEMTIPARLFLVFSFQRKPGGLVIEINLFPGQNGMAVFTFSFRNIFFGNRIEVNVFMTGNAVRIHVAEIPFIRFFVARKTRSCSVGSL